MTMHISKTVSTCFAMLQQIPSICRSLTRPVLQSVVATFGTDATRLWHSCSCCTIMSGCSPSAVVRLQLQLDCDGKRAHFTLVILYEFRSGFAFQLAVLVYRVSSTQSCNKSPTSACTVGCVNGCRFAIDTQDDLQLCLPISSIVWNRLPWHITSPPSLLLWCSHGGAPRQQQH